MINQQLIDFIIKAKGEGKTNEQINIELLSAGWGTEDINLGLSSINPSFEHRKKYLTPLIITLLILLTGSSVFYFKDNLSNVLSNKDKGTLKYEDLSINNKEIVNTINESKPLEDSELNITALKENNNLTSTPPLVTELKPSQLRFLSPENNQKVILDGSVSIRIQTGEKIKKISLMFIMNDSIFENQLKDIDIPVHTGYANYVINLPGTTLAPIAILARGIADDNNAYLVTENSLSEKEAGDMMRTIRPYTDKLPNAFILEKESQETNRILVGQTESLPQFLAGFPGGHGLTTIWDGDIVFKVNNPGFLQIIKATNGVTIIKGLKEGSSSVTATYKGLSNDLYYVIE